MIPSELLLRFIAQEIQYVKDETIFQQGTRADYFYQIKSGSVTMSTLSEDGKQFSQGLFKAGESFGEPILFMDHPYPSTAVATEETVIYRLFKDSFFEMIEANPKLLLQITKKLSELLYFKSKMSSEISLYDPEHRILTLLDHLKKTDAPEKIDLTRQQIAHLTALRVETVIRAIKTLEDKGKLKIIARKVYY